jgi:hypothetical protein
VTQEEHHAILETLRAARDELWSQVNVVGKFPVPPLKNIPANQPLSKFLLSQPLLPRGSVALDGKWIHELLAQLGEVIDKAQRIHFKNLGGILTFQEKLAGLWLARRSGAAPSAVDERSLSETQPSAGSIT